MLALAGLLAACLGSDIGAAAISSLLAAGLLLSCLRWRRRTLLPGTRGRLLHYFGEAGLEALRPQEIMTFWRERFPEIDMSAAIAEAERAGRASFTVDDFISCWQVIKDSGLNDSEILEELDTMHAFIRSLHLLRLRTPQVQCPFSGVRGPAY